MAMVTAKLTVFFEEQFWVGVYERTEDGNLEVCRVVFGAEPRDCEVYAYFLEHWGTLRFSPPVEAGGRLERRMNPKRMQRAVKDQLIPSGMGTKAQQALKLQQEQRKAERKAAGKRRSEAEKERLFDLRSAKRKEKHRGR